MEERPESVLDTLERWRRGESLPILVGSSCGGGRRWPTIPAAGGGCGSWSKESRAMPRGLLLLPATVKSRTPPDCASAAAAALLLPRGSCAPRQLTSSMLPCRPPPGALPKPADGDDCWLLPPLLRKVSVAEARR
jgi:hypothetical protein